MSALRCYKTTVFRDFYYCLFFNFAGTQVSLLRVTAGSPTSILFLKSAVNIVFGCLNISYILIPNSEANVKQRLVLLEFTHLEGYLYKCQAYIAKLCCGTHTAGAESGVKHPLFCYL